MKRRHAKSAGTNLFLLLLTPSSHSFGESTGSLGNSIVSGKWRLVDHITDKGVVKRRWTTIRKEQHAWNPTFRIVPLRIPTASPLYSQVTLLIATVTYKLLVLYKNIDCISWARKRLYSWWGPMIGRLWPISSSDICSMHYTELGP